MMKGDKLVAAPAGARTLGIVPRAGGGYLGRAMLGAERGSRVFRIPRTALPYLGYGLDPDVFAGGVSVRLAGAPAMYRAKPAAGDHTLTVTGTSLAGQPDTGDPVIVTSADDANKAPRPLQAVGVFHNGVAKFHLPPGHYWAVAAFITKVNDHSVIVPQFSLFANATLHLAARTATSPVRTVTPRPSVPSLFNLNFEVRHPTPGGGTGAVWWQGGPLTFNTTTRKPTVGSLQTYLYTELNSPASAAGTPYQYNLASADTSGLIHPQRHVVRQSGLATVRSSYYSDVSTTGYFSRFGVFPVQFNEVPGVFFLPFRVPRQETEYMIGNPAVLWDDNYEQYFKNLAGGQGDDLRTFSPGEHLTENWNTYPLHEGYNTNLIGAENLAASIPSASRKGDALTVDVMPFSDSTLGHVSADGFFGGFEAPYGTITGHFQIDENGKTIASGNPLPNNQQVGPFGEFHDTVTLSPHPATIAVTLDASRTGKPYTISTASHTVWTWRSAHESGSQLPAGWTCGLASNGRPAGGRACGAEPMMTLEYTVQGESPHGSTSAGPQAVHISVGHLQLVKPIAVTKAAMSVSFDGGKTWHPATVTGHGGSYTATFTAPAGAKVSLRTSAADAAGGAVTETLINGYQLAG